MFSKVKMFFNWQAFLYVYILFSSFIVNELMATIISCIENKIMENKKLDAIFDAFLFLGFLFIASASFLYLCIVSPHNTGWYPFNLFLCLFFELVVLFFLFIYVIKSVDELLDLNKQMKAPDKVKVNPKLISILLERMQIYSIGTIGYALIMLFYPVDDIKYLIIYSLNILLVALLFFVWLLIKKRDLERCWIMGNYCS